MCKPLAVRCVDEENVIMQEHFFGCPYCGAEISMLLDPSIRQQRYIEDCEVCCNPIQVTLVFEKLDLIEFRADSIEQ